MDTQELISRYLPLARKHWLLLSLGALGMIFFVYGLIGLFVSGRSASEDIIFESNSVKSASTEAITIAVDIEGAVVKPGLYKLPQGSRIQDSLISAGGLSASADRNYVSKNLNLATKLTDGAKIYIPFLGEAVSNNGVLNSANIQSTGGLININNASQAQLESLQGIAQARARDIIAGRPYSSVDELLSKKIVGAKVFDQIKDKISAY